MAVCKQRWSMLTYEVAVGILLRLESSSVKDNVSAFLLGAGNQALNLLLGLGADDGTEVSTLLETSVDVQGLCALGDLVDPVLGLAD